MEADERADLEKRLRTLNRALDVVIAVVTIAYLVDVLTHGELKRALAWHYRQAQQRLTEPTKARPVPDVVRAAEQHVTDYIRQGKLG